MKKISLFWLFAVGVMLLTAQTRESDLMMQTILNHRVQPLEQLLLNTRSPQQYLVARVSSDGYERKSFFYDYREHVVAVRDSIGPDLVVDTIEYDNNNNVIQIRTYQYLNGVWKYVS